MSTLRVDGTDVEAAFRKAGVSVIERVDQALGQGALLVQREWVRRVPKAEGTLMRRIHSGRLAQLSYHITSQAPHARFVEEGTGLLGPTKTASGNRMLSDRGVAGIAQWLKRKGITPRTPGVTEMQLPWLIARKIALQGTRAQPTRDDALKSQEPQILRLVREATERGLAAAGLKVG